MKKRGRMVYLTDDVWAFALKRGLELKIKNASASAYVSALLEAAMKKHASGQNGRARPTDNTRTGFDGPGAMAPEIVVAGSGADGHPALPFRCLCGRASDTTGICSRCREVLTAMYAPGGEGACL